MIHNLIDPAERAKWNRLKWEYVERVQEQEPHLQLGWYDLTTLVQLLEEEEEGE